MTTPTRLQGDLTVVGNLSASTMTMPAGSVTNAAIIASAGIAASKLQHQFEVVYAQVATVAAANEQKVVHVVRGVTATLLDFAAGAVTAYGAASSCVFDLLKNGTTILTGTITLDNTTAAYVLKSPAGYTSTALVVGDVLTVKVSGDTGANHALGLFARVSLLEDAA